MTEKLKNKDVDKTKHSRKEIKLVSPFPCLYFWLISFKNNSSFTTTAVNARNLGLFLKYQNVLYKSVFHKLNLTVFE
jgi:hypothetical protein